MADQAPQQGSYPNLNANGINPGSASYNDSTSAPAAQASSFQDRIVNNAQSAANTVANHPVTQNITQGPMAEKARVEANKTSNEFSNVANARRTPDQPAATGQPLTHYHSLFFNILSWENPRVSAISYAAIVSAIFFTRYVPVLKYFFKGTYIVLGIIAAAEVAGKLIFDKGLASNMRPRKYYTLPRESLEASLEDVEQFVNFFVIEFQRIIFAENIYATVAAFSAALLGALFVKIVPTWGLALIATTVVYFVPLIYVNNRELIDHHVNNASNIISEQSTQVRDLAAQHAGRAGEATKSTLSQYSAKAQELIGQGKDKATSHAASPNAPNPANLNPVKNEPQRDFKTADFPSAPSSEPTSFSTSTGNVGGSQPLSSASHSEPHADAAPSMAAL